MIAYSFLPLRDYPQFGIVQQVGVGSTAAWFLTPQQAKEIARRKSPMGEGK